VPSLTFQDQRLANRKKLFSQRTGVPREKKQETACLAEAKKAEIKSLRGVAEKKTQAF